MEENQDIVTCQNCAVIVAIESGRCSNCGDLICTVCGCTRSAACPGGCFWTREGVCSQCDAATADELIKR